MESISDAIEDQKNLVNHIERMLNAFNQKPKDDKSKGYVQTMLEDLELTYKTFKDGHEQIMETVRNNTINENDVPYISTDVYYKCYDTYIILKTNMLDLIFEFESPQTPTVHASTFATSSSRNETFSAGARLPKIDLPKFSGDYIDWISYRDMFLSMVHNNNSLSNIQKYLYLKGSCTGTPLSLVNEYPAADSSYNSAWEALEKRYHNERKLEETIFKRLFSISPTTGTFESVEHLLDSTRNCLAQLKVLGIDISTWDPILIYLTTQKLDIQTRKEWEQSLKSSTSKPKMSEMFCFLENTFRALESVNEDTNSTTSKSIKEKHTEVRKKPMRNVRAHIATAIPDDNCPCCHKRHPLYKCFKFTALSSTEKKNIVNNQRLCRNCLRTGHMQATCKLNTSCQICSQPHHTIIHNEFSTVSSPNMKNKDHDNNINQTFENPTTTSTPTTNSVSTHISNINSTEIVPALLATVKVLINMGNSSLNVKALVDQGSQVSFISEKLSKWLPIPKYKININVSGIGGNQHMTVKKYVQLALKSNYDKQFELPLTALVVPVVTSYVPNKFTLTEFSDLSEYYLADPNFMLPEKIDLLLGNDVYGDLLLPRMKKYKNSFLLQETRFGWMVSGPPGSPSSDVTISSNICSLEEQLRLFWEQEELTPGKTITQEGIVCEKLFTETHTRDEKGRYCVHLPFKNALQGLQLPTFSYTDYNALKRLNQLELTFKSKPKFAEEYQKFMDEYESLHHMVKLGEYPNAVPKNSYFLPHHGVLRESSSTTKLRVVFDGSSRRPPQPSLNEELSAGPPLQNDLATIITRWRRFQYAFTADIEKMFRQINVCSEHQNYQCILWRDKNSNKICVYALRTVTYGTTSAPYLAIRVLQQLASDEEDNFPEASRILRSDTYVDDVISGADDFDKALILQKQLCSLLKSGGFRLRKWNSNSTELLQQVPIEDREKKELFSIHQPNIAKALGIYWDTTNDYFSFSINFTFSNHITKRSLLSDAAKLFDPLGWLSPTTIVAKIIFQQLWKIKLDWNDSLPDNIQHEWINFRSKLKDLEKIKIPRWIEYHTTESTVDLHAFSDASKSAYAAVVYARTVSESGKVYINLLQAKTKVAPLKAETIPRLELSAATLLVKLVDTIKCNTDLNIGRIVYWTDSTIVLAWIKNYSRRLEVYVANRVATICRLSNAEDWKYVPSLENPADCASRGLQPAELVHHKLWFNGPSWLKLESDKWPAHPIELKCDNDNVNIAAHLADLKSPTAQYPDITLKFSKLSTLIRVTSYILRFYNNIKLCIQKKEKETGFLKTYELTAARFLLIKLTQAVSFHDDIRCLKLNKPLPANSRIGKLSPFLDKMDILRVGGRLANAEIPFHTKFPILLAKQNPLSLLIFSEAHLNTLHGSLQLMQSYISRYYWIVSARGLAKRVQSQCIVCFKYKTQTCQQLMGNLPPVRLQPTRAFKHSGVDYAGPINIKLSSLRTSSTSKAYICLFICMCTKAIHLEAVTSLNVDAFIAAYRRFTSRRGICTDLYSDCGTNFVGANKELQILYQRNRSSLPEHLVETLANQGTTWHFIPPASPHFGGLWEAGVKSTKHHLRRIMKDRVLTYEELSTLLAQIESCLNSRPLCPLSSDPADCNSLTPAHFLIGEPTNCIPSEDCLDEHADRLSRWNLVELLKQQFWVRWHEEYMSRLQSRPKWNKIERNVKVGDLVLLLHEKSCPGQWPLARIEKLNPGPDGLVRVVTLYCNKKYMKRPISKICLLPSTEVPTSQEN